jgi:ABC-type Fe3+ transport system substrate-binding protein
MEETQVKSSIELVEDQKKTAHLNFLGFAPSLLKYAFREGLDNALRTYRMETGDSIRSYGPIGYEDKYEGIWKTQHIDDFPDAITAMGLGDLFGKEFVERFVNKGCFKNVWDGPLNKHFVEAGLVDPYGYYTIYSAMPFLMLIDKKKLGDLPMPTRWSDLFDPRFQSNVILPGTENEVFAAPLLYFYKDYGEEGLKMLAANMKMALRSAEMARMAGSSRSEAAVYVITWLFARSCPRTETSAVVWPKDGALISPVYMLVKKDKIDKLAPIIRYTLGQDFGRQLAQSCYPVINPQVDNMLPEGASFKWIGWDYIRSHNIVELRERAQEFFITTWRKSHGKEK